MNRFILFKSIEHSWLYRDKHLKGFHCNISVLISDNSLSYAIVSDISNLGSVSSNCNSLNVKDYDKNSSHSRLVLENLKLKNNDRLAFGNLNINSISNKFGNLKLIIQGKINILVITKTKTDSTFPWTQFSIQGYSKPYKFDRNRNGGGVFTYVRKDIPGRDLKIHNTSEDIESIFIEINLIKTKWLFCGCYHPPSQSDQNFSENNGKTLFKYSKHYDKFMLVGDLKAEESEPCLSQFLYEYNAKNTVKENVCFKNALNPSCIDLFITKSPLSFQNIIAVSNVLSDFHKMVITVMKMSFKKHSFTERHYKDYKYFNRTKFKNNLNEKFNKGISDYESFETIFIEVLNKQAPLRKKFLELIMLHTSQKAWGKR